MIGIRPQNNMKASKARANEINEHLAIMKKRALTFFSRRNSSKRQNSGYQATPERDLASGNSLSRRFVTTSVILSKLGVLILPDRRVCFAGRILKGMYMPRNRWLQYQILERMALWYLPCLEIQGNVYSLSNTCYTRKENKLLKQLESN